MEEYTKYIHWFSVFLLRLISLAHKNIFMVLKPLPPPTTMAFFFPTSLTTKPHPDMNHQIPAPIPLLILIIHLISIPFQHFLPWTNPPFCWALEKPEYKEFIDGNHPCPRKFLDLNKPIVNPDRVYLLAMLQSPDNELDLFILGWRTHDSNHWVFNNTLLEFMN